MRIILRQLLATTAGMAGLGAIILTLNPAMLEAQPLWTVGAITLLIAATIISSVQGMAGIEAASAGPTPSDAEFAARDKEFQDEVAKIIGLLRAQTEANGSFTNALNKANEQLPGLMKPEQIGLVVSYLMIENENMRKKTSNLQANLEQSQRQVERLKSTLAVAEAQGMNDALTTLKNRRGFDVTLAAEAAGAKSAGKPLTLVMTDIDHFKVINDRYGHQIGDDVLRWFAKLLSSNMKGRDTVARYGGEEFAIILPQTNLETGSLLASQIREQLAANPWINPDAPGLCLRITASFGVAQLAEGESTSGLIGRADAKLYEAKSTGRNRVAA